MAEHPPKARLVLRVGVTGHRIEALQQAGYEEVPLRSAIGMVLLRISDILEQVFRENRDLYAPEPPLLRIISPLAEGSDRLVADEAIRLKHGIDREIQTPLPFNRKEYEKDFFEESSKSNFRGLLAKATAVCELDGSREAQDRAYEMVGRVVLRQSDVIIAIWDGKQAKGKGGTGQIVKEALLRKIPTVWITPSSITLLERLTDEDLPISPRDLDELVPARTPEPKVSLWNRLVKRTLSKKREAAPPARIKLFDARLRDILTISSPEGLRSLRLFLEEPQPQFRAALVYRLFCRIFVHDWPIPERELEDFETLGEGDWRTPTVPSNSSDTSVTDQIERNYRRPFVWSDVIADICADRYRSSFIATYALGALAVLSAFLGAETEHLKGAIEKTAAIHTPQTPADHPWFIVELVFISAILILVSCNKLGRWHERWIDYRLLAEGFRQMKVLAPFARVTPTFEVPAHLSEDDPAPTWFNWYFRAMVRNAGLIKAVLTEKYLESCHNLLTSEISSQVTYHNKTEKRHDKLHSYLHILSIGLFLLTLLACLAHISSKEIIEALLGSHAESVLTLCAIVLPAFGAAIQGILHQGEIGRLAHRSLAIKNRLNKLLDQVVALELPLSFRELGRAAEYFSEIQILEQDDWRSVFIIKEISLP